MKSLSAKTFQCGVTVQGLTTLSGTVYLTALTNTATWDYVIVGTSAQGQLYTRTYAQIMSDITSGIGLSGYVPTSRTLTINGVSYDLTANRSWTITTPYVSKLQHAVKAGVAINKGQAVYVTGADGTNMIVGLASNASEATSSKTMGLLDATVSTNGFANVVTEGLLAGLDTSTAGTEGDPVWLGTGGNLIYGLAGKPYAPAHLVFIGIVTRKNNSNGEIFVKVQNGFELKEIHDVDLITTAPINGHLLGYNGTLWVNKTIATWLGYTPANASGTTNYISKFTGSTTLGNSQIFDNGTNVGIGTTSPSLESAGIGLDILNSSYTQLRVRSSSSSAGIEMTPNAGKRWEIQANASSKWFVYDRTDQLYRLLIDTAGNVGIGTTSPATKLSLAGSTATTFGLSLEPSGWNNAKHRLTVPTSGDASMWSFNWDGSATDSALYATSAITIAQGVITLSTTGSANAPVARMTITSAGNIGIGTSSPSYKLDVNGTGRFVGNSGAPALQITDGGSTFSVLGISGSQAGDVNWLLMSGYPSAGNFTIRQSDTVNALVIEKTTGAATFSNRIDATGATFTGAGSSILLVRSTSTSGYATTDYFNSSNSQVASFGYGNASVSAAPVQNAAYIYTAPGVDFVGYMGGAERLRIASTGLATFNSLSGTGTRMVVADASGALSTQAIGSGAVTGSGTTNYLPKFTSASTIGNSIMSESGSTISIAGGLTASGIIAISGTGLNSSLRINNTTASTGIDWHIYSLNNGNFGLYNNTAGAYAYQVTPSGNLGLGVSTPTFAGGTGMHINASGNDVRLHLTNSTSGALSTDGFELAYVASDIYYDNKENGSHIWYANNGERMRLNASGNLSVGNTNDTYKLDVNGDINFSSTLKFGGVTVLSNNASDVYANIRVIRNESTSLSDGMYIGYNNSGGTSGHLRFFANGANERMRIDASNGNVGINTTNPSGQLSGTKGLSIVDATNAALGLSNGTNHWLNYLSGTTYRIWNNNVSEVMTLTLGGNVGIGTTSPSAKLHIGESGAAAQLWLQRTDGYNPIKLIGGTLSDGNGFKITMNTTDAFSITSDGNVGISTTSPATRLTLGAYSGARLPYIDGTGNTFNANGITVTSANSANTAIGGGIDLTNNTYSTGSYSPIVSFSSISSNGSFNAAYAGVWGIVSSQGVDANWIAGHLAFGSGGGAGISERMRITSGGNVGIGTTAPNAKLHVWNGGIKTTGFPSAGNPFTFLESNYNDFAVTVRFLNLNPSNGFDADLGIQLMNTGGSMVDVFTIKGSTGNVGIGTSSPATKLDVSGVITATGGNSTNWNTAYGWGNHSSAGYVPQARTLTINGTTYDLSANRTWAISIATAAGSDTQVQYNSSGSLAGASALTYNSTTNRVGINQASPGYNLDVNGQVRVQDKLRVGTVNSGNGVVHMSSTATINASATTIVWAQNVSVGMCAFIEYYILNSNSLTDQRAGTIIVTWNQSGTPTITHTETTTPDIGSTTTVNFTSSLVGSDARINAVNSSANPYTMVMSYKYF